MPPASRSRRQGHHRRRSGNNRHFETKTDKKGEFLQIGLAPGAYKVTAEKDKVVSAPSNGDACASRAGNPITLVLGGGGGGGASPEVAAKTAALKKAFEEGVTREPRRQARRGDREVHRPRPS